jgi:ABC-type uncharacterized transport system, permease component
MLSRGLAGHLVLIPLMLHGYLLVQDIFATGSFNFGLLNALSLIVWLTLLVYWLARFFYPIGSLQALVLPLAAVTAGLPEWFPSSHLLPHTRSLAFTAHIGAAMLSYSLFTIAVLHAVLISQVERQLHQVMLPRVLRSLPPLLSMESLLFRLIGIGFVVLSLTLVSGVVFSEEYSARPGSLIIRWCSVWCPGWCLPFCCGGIMCMAGAAGWQYAGRWPALSCCCSLIWVVSSSSRCCWDGENHRYFCNLQRKTPNMS